VDGRNVGEKRRYKSENYGSKGRCGATRNSGVVSGG